MMNNVNVLDYFQVGDNYYKYIAIPSNFRQDELRLVTRQISTIERLIPKRLIQNIPYYEDFCNVPDHVDYVREIYNCFNLYSKLEHKPERGECYTILDFLKHIFGIQYELGLDYLQLLYTRPMQNLPILCLFSTLNSTGKTTFIKLLKAIFTANCAIIGNDDLQNKLNYYLAGKLLICFYEECIEKKELVERIKMFSTANSVLVKSNGNHSQIDFYGKFILSSYLEDNYLDNYDERFWVIKTQKVMKCDPHLLNKMKQEIPAFLDFLNSRKLFTKQKSRMWFDSKQLK